MTGEPKRTAEVRAIDGAWWVITSVEKSVMVMESIQKFQKETHALERAAEISGAPRRIDRPCQRCGGFDYPLYDGGVCSRCCDENNQRRDPLPGPDEQPF